MGKRSEEILHPRRHMDDKKHMKIYSTSLSKMIISSADYNAKQPELSYIAGGKAKWYR